MRRALGIEGSGEPEICRFLGIVIYMYHREHGPAHFHAKYGESRMTVEIETGAVNGRFPVRARRFVMEWAMKHRDELRANWKRSRDKGPLKTISPLE